MAGQVDSVQLRLGAEHSAALEQTARPVHQPHSGTGWQAEQEYWLQSKRVKCQLREFSGLCLGDRTVKS